MLTNETAARNVAMSSNYEAGFKVRMEQEEMHDVGRKRGHGKV